MCLEYQKLFLLSESNYLPINQSLLILLRMPALFSAFNNHYSAIYHKFVLIVTKSMASDGCLGFLC